MANRFELIDGNGSTSTPISDFKRAVERVETATRSLLEAYSALPEEDQQQLDGALLKALGRPAVAASPGAAAPGAQPSAAEPASERDAMFNSLTYTLIVPFKNEDGVTVAMCRPSRPLTRAEMAAMGYAIDVEDDAS
jgi:hypothetical protein